MNIDEVNVPPYAASDLPVYSPDARPDERTVDVTTNTSAPSSVSQTQEYRYKNGSLVLNLGPKRFEMFRPTYGWNDTVEGFVIVKKKTKHVASVVVTVEGHVTTGFSERGFLTDQVKTTVLRLSQTLFDASSGEEFPSNEGARYPFSFPLPSYVMGGGGQPLPPTFAEQHPGVGADVRYSVRVDLVRRGMLRQNEKLVAWFYYLPRAYAPLSWYQALEPEELNPLMDDNMGKWCITSIPPQSPCAAASACAAVSVSFALPQPLVYAAGSAIPFSIMISSGTATEALPLLLSCLSVRLIRVTTLVAGTRRSINETTIGGGEVVRISNHEDSRVMLGSITRFKRGEASWAVNNVNIKYVVRVRLAPREDVPSLAHVLPTYALDKVVVLRTHQRTWQGEDMEARLPALCLAPRPIICM